MHPAIDAAIQLRNQYQLKPDQIDTINLRVNPLVLELTGKKAPTAGLEGKFSIYHAVAVAIVEGAAGEKQFSDRAVQDPVIVALRTRVVPVAPPELVSFFMALAIKISLLRSCFQSCVCSLVIGIVDGGNVRIDRPDF
jgi:2-methylcitrate dehydratase PrpD